jgi:hypothetical protein
MPLVANRAWHPASGARSGLNLGTRRGVRCKVRPWTARVRLSLEETVSALGDAKDKIKQTFENVRDGLDHQKGPGEPSDFNHDVPHGGGETAGSAATPSDDV